MPIDYVLQDNDVLTSSVHRHELPVLALDVKIVFESETMLIVDKPPSIPVHPCGRYRFNSMTAIMRKEYGYEDLFSKLLLYVLAKAHVMTNLLSLQLYTD